MNEYQGGMSLNINQSTRIAVLEGTRPVIAPANLEINTFLKMDLFVLLEEPFFPSDKSIGKMGQVL